MKSPCSGRRSLTCGEDQKQQIQMQEAALRHQELEGAGAILLLPGMTALLSENKQLRDAIAGAGTSGAGEKIRRGIL